MCKTAGERPPSTQEQPHDEEINGRYNDAEIERLLRENEIMRAEIDEIKDMVASIQKTLLGNGGSGVREMIDSIIGLVEQLGGILEGLHRQGQLQGQVIESLLSKLQLEKVLIDVLAVWQAHNVALMAGESNPIGGGG